MQGLHPPGPLAHGAEGDQLLQRLQQVGGLGGRVRRQLGQPLLVLAQRLQHRFRQPLGRRLQPAQVGLRGQGRQAGAQLPQRIGAGGAGLVAQLLRDGGDGAVVAVGGAQLHGGGAQGLQALRPAQLLQHRPGPHGRQLARIPHQHQGGAGGQGRQQGGHQRQVHHGGFIHHQQVELQRQARAAAEAPLPLGLQQPVQGAAGDGRQPLAQGGLERAGGGGLRHGLRQPRGRLAGGGGQLGPPLGPLAQRGRQQLHHGGGFAGARPPQQQHQPVAQHRRHRLRLLLVEAGGLGPLQGRLQRRGRHRGLGLAAGPLQQLVEAVLQLQVPAPPAQPAAIAHDRRLGPLLQGVRIRQPAAGPQGLQQRAGPGVGRHGLRGFGLEVEPQVAPLQGGAEGRNGQLQQRLGAGGGGGQQPQQAVAQRGGEGGARAAHGCPSCSSRSRASSRGSGGCSTSTPATPASRDGSAGSGPGTPRRNT